MINQEKRIKCCERIAVVLVILWMLGLVSGYKMGNFIHILLSGFVNSQQAVDKAGEITRSVKGVKSMKNNLLIK